MKKRERLSYEEIVAATYAGQNLPPDMQRHYLDLIDAEDERVKGAPISTRRRNALLQTAEAVTIVHRRMKMRNQS